MKKAYLLIIVLVLIPLILVFIYLNTYYKASNEVHSYLKSSGLVKVKKDNNGYLFDGPSDDKIFVFYPGAKVEYISYAPLMSEIAREGVDTFVVNMPFNIAFFNTDAVLDVMKDYDYDKWYIGGHSLGGAVSAMNVDKAKFEGLILLASYSTNKVNCRVLSIYGSNDGVLNLKKYNDSKKNYKDNVEIIIDGGNHSYFGNYGEQKGDNKSKITRNIQQEKTKDAIISFINESL